jgi:hypothetical protein
MSLVVVVSGMIAGDPGQGGASWAVLQYVLGLRRLGHDVYFVEPIAGPSLRPAGAALAASHNAAYFRLVASRFGLEGRSALLASGTRETLGLAYEDLRRIAARADVLLNISGMLQDGALLEPIPRRVYLDLDPAFNQLWHDRERIDMRFDGHTHFVSIAQDLGAPGCRVPSCGRRWVPTFQPVVLDEWPVAGPVERDAFTTVGNWRGYGSIEHEGVLYGQKAHSLRRLIDLPTRTPETFELALAIHPDERKDLDALARNGWKLLDPARVAATPDCYRRFIAGSRAELGVAKSGYVEARCGWFSDRSLCYLASGRPVIAQETGFSRYLPVGEGLLSFETCDGAVAAAGAIRSDYERHRRAARAIAEGYFDSNRVLARLLESVGAEP